MKSSVGSVEASFVGKRALRVSVAALAVFYSFHTSTCPQESFTKDTSSNSFRNLGPFRAAVRPLQLPHILCCWATAQDERPPGRVKNTDSSDAPTTEDDLWREPEKGDHRLAPRYGWKSTYCSPSSFSIGLPRRLSGLIGRTLKKLAVWQPVERALLSVNLDMITFVAGNHRADRSSAFQAPLEDVLILFLRWFDADKRRCVWPLQGLVSMEALRRVHQRYGQQMVRDFSKKQDEMREDEEKRKSKLRSIEFYTQLGAVQRRIASWFFDGNTFHRRGPEASSIPKTLAESDVDFFRGLPFNMLRVAHGVHSPRTPESVHRLEKELTLRGVNSLSGLLSRTNLFDLFVLLDIFDESFAQIDVLREYVANWRRCDTEGFKPADIPRGTWKEKESLEEFMIDPRRPQSVFPRCTTLKCTMRYYWQKTPEKNIQVMKKDVNSLKLLLIGSTGVSSCPPEDKRKGWLQRLKKVFSMDVLEKTVRTMREWHEKEKADAVLGLGDILGLPGPRTVQDQVFETKWYNPFIKDGGLDVPWLMILGDNDAVVSPSAQIRYHYTQRHPNWHMPNDYYTVTFQFGANLTLSEGATESEQFNATVVNLNTWDLLAGNPVADNMEGWTHKLHWLSEQLYTAAQKNSTWLLVTGHHPVVSTGPEGEQARLQYVVDLYKSGRPRGLECRFVQLLLLHYQVDAYLSAHDYFMEYTALKDKDNDVVVSFISSGAGARLLDYHLGQGWVGRLRGALYPVLCWAGRRVLFSLNPGGCKPLSRDRDQAARFYAPAHGAYQIDIVERVTRKNGFVALKLSRESMVVEFVDSQSGKPAAHSVHRKPNKAARALRFLDPYAAGKVKYEELLLDREAFAEENKELIENEVEFYRRCPVLAERISLCVKELNEIVDLYEDIAQHKEAYEVMDDAGREVMMAQGVNVLTKTSQLLGDMYMLSKDYRNTSMLYNKLVKIKKMKPKADNPRWTELLELEKRYTVARRRRRELTGQLTADDAQADPELEKELNEEIKSMKLIRKEMDDIDADIERTTAEATPEKEVTLTGKEVHLTFKEEKEAAAMKVKPLETSVAARIKRKEALLRRHYKLLDDLRTRPTSELVQLKPEIEILKRQTAVIRRELMRLQQLLRRAQSPMLPSEVWEKFKTKEELENQLKQMRAYLFRVSRLPATTRFSTTIEAEVESVEMEKARVERELTDLVDELQDRELTSLQMLYLARVSELRRSEQILQQRDKLSPAQLDVPQVAAALKKAEDAQNVLYSEVEAAHERLLEELGRLDEEWRKKHPNAVTQSEVVVGPDVEQLGKKDAEKVLKTGEVTQAEAALQLLEETRDYVSNLQEAVRLIKTSSPEEVKEIEDQWGPVESLPHKLNEARKRVNELEEVLKRMEQQLEQNAPARGIEARGAVGAGRRRLDDIMDMFKEKREPSPYKKLEKIEVGQTDPCMQLSFLEAAIKRVLQHQEDKESKDKCVYELANQVYREQFRYIHPGIFFSQTETGMTPALFDKPSVHVERAFSMYFGHTHLTRFKCTLKEIREGIDWIHEHVASLSPADVGALEKKQLRDRHEEDTLLSDEEELEWSGDSEVPSD